MISFQSTGWYDIGLKEISFFYVIKFGNEIFFKKVRLLLYTLFCGNSVIKYL